MYTHNNNKYTNFKQEKADKSEKIVWNGIQIFLGMTATVLEVMFTLLPQPPSDDSQIAPT